MSQSDSEAEPEAPAQPVGASEDPTPPGFTSSLLAIVGVGLAALLLRLPLVNSAPWLDELWSLGLAQKAAASGLGPMAIFQIKHDNNHLLNTLWLSLLGPSPEPWMMRLPSILAGLAAVVAVMLLTRRWGMLTMLGSGLWVAQSSLMLSLTTQARGYGGMLFCALAAAACLLSAEGRHRRRAELAYRSFACVGLFFHLSMIHVLGGFFLYSAWQAWRENEPSQALRAWLRLNLLPLGTSVLLALFFVREMEVGALVGPRGSLEQALLDALSAFVGSAGASHSPWLGLALLLGSALVIAREGGSTRSLLSLALLSGLLAPALIVFVLEPPVLYARYFLPSIAILALLPPLAASCLWRRGRRAPAILGLLLLFSGHLPDTNQLLRSGHGAFPELIAEIRKAEPEGAILGCSFSGFLALEEGFHRARLEEMNGLMTLCEPEQAGLAGWWVVPAYGGDEPVLELTLAGQKFRLFASYPARPWSGFPIHLYRRVDS